MKKISIMIAAVCAVFASCSNDNGVVDNEPAKEIKASDIKLNISVADMGGSTKAAKTGWVAGDKINIWIDDMDVMSMIGDCIGRAELTLTYDGEKWTGAFDEYYATNAAGLTYTIKEAGVLNCLYEGGNKISDWSVAIADKDYTFSAPSNGAAPITPLVCFTQVGYEYDSTTQTLSAKIGGWFVLTMIQVVVPGLESSKAENYTLGCDNMYNMLGVSVNSEFGDAYADYCDTDPTCGVSNADGVAFCFYDIYDSVEPYTFTLSDGTNTWVYEAGKKEIETSSEKVYFIKLPALTEAGKWTKR